MVLPESVMELMWEYDPDGLKTLSDLPDVIIERVMERGRWSDMRWLLQAAGRARLKVFLEQRGSRALPPRELRFWSWIAGIPEPKASEWVRLAKQRESSWRR